MTATHSTNAGAGPMDGCVICGKSLFGRPPGALVCSSLACDFALTAIPAYRRCSICARPLSGAQLARGMCDRPACAQTWLTSGPIAKARAERKQLIARATLRRNRSAAQRGMSTDEREHFVVAMIPKNHHRSAKLPARRREIFERHLRSNLADAHAAIARGELSDSETGLNDPEETTLSPELREAEKTLLGQGCGLCRGHCCTAGVNHAFNRVGTMIRYLNAHPDEDDETIVATYLSYIGERTMTGGCLYQQETGCSMPRDMRGAVCNRFYCSGLQAIRNKLGDGDVAGAYYVHRDGHTFTGGTFVQIQMRASERAPSVT